MKKRNQHYIPQFYLNYFTDPLTPSTQAPYVWILDKKNETIKNRAPKNFAYKKGYNDILNEKGELSIIVENQFKQIEDKASIVMKKISRLEYIKKSDRLIMCEFVFSMATRVPKFQEVYKLMVNKEYYKGFLNGKLKNTTLPLELPMDSVIRATNATSYLLLKMKWSILIAPDGSSFITSDNPVIIKNDDNQTLYGIFSGNNVQILFPLSASICLFGEWIRRRSIIERIDKNELEDINFEVYKYSNNYVFSASKNFMDEILLLNEFINKVQR